MARYVYLVLALPDEDTADEPTIANGLHVQRFNPDDADDEGTEPHFTVYSQLAHVIRDQLDGCALNGYWAGTEADEDAQPVPVAC